MVRCAKCKIEMKKGHTMNSANTLFQEWICPHCGSNVMRAVGTM